MIIFQKGPDSLGSQKIIKTKNMILEECGNFFKMNMMINSKQPLYSITIVKFLINKDEFLSRISCQFNTNDPEQRISSLKII